MIGTLATLVYLGRRDRRLDVVEELAGLGRSRPLPAAALALFAVSLVGIPPAAGFWGKLAVMRCTLDLAHAGGDDLRPWFVAAAVIAAINLVMAAVYHLRIVAVMYLRMPLGTPKAEGGRAAAATAGVCATLTILVGLIPGPFINACNRAAENIPGPVAAESQNCTQEPDTCRVVPIIRIASDAPSGQPAAAAAVDGKTDSPACRCLTMSRNLQRKRP